MRNNVYIHKIGGAGLMMSRKELSSLLLRIIREAPQSNFIFVVSALAGVTRLLDNLVKAIKDKEKAKTNFLFMNFKIAHEEMIGRLIPFDHQIYKEMNIYYSQMEEIIYSKTFEHNEKYQANLLKYGEICSSSIFRIFVDIFIHSYLLDARDCIVTKNDSYTLAGVDLVLTLEKTKNKLDQIEYNSIVTQGYIAKNYLGEDTVLGYDGSDLTAAIFALASLLDKKNEVQLSYWKDILGVWENPHKETDGIFEKMKISEYLEFSKQNQVPVLTEAIRILEKVDPSRLNIFIRSFLNLENPGTLITP